MPSASRFRIPLALALAGSLAVPLAGRASTLSPTHTDIGRFLPEPDATAGLSVGDPRGLSLGQYALSLTLDDAIDPLSLEREDGSRPVLVPDRFEGYFGGLVGLYGPLSLGLEVPVVFQSGSLAAMPLSTQPLANGALAHAAFGDLRIDPRVQVLSESRSGVDLAVIGGLTVPTGSAGAMTTDDGIGGEAYVSVAKSLYGGRLLGDLGVRFRPSGKIIQLDVGNELLVRLAAVYPLKKVVHVPLEALGELDVGTLLNSPFGNARETPAEWRLGARYCIEHHLAVTAAFGGGLTEAYGTPLARFIAGIGYDPRACLATGEAIAKAGTTQPATSAAALVDTDHDGIPDIYDECPTVPGVPEYHGCPPPPPADSDGDGIFDKDDWCPNVPGPLVYHGCPTKAAMEAAAKARAAGVAAAPAQTKALGLLSTVQPMPPPKPAVLPAPVASAVPSLPRSAAVPGDRDGDGVPDAIDNCPDVKGPAKYHGCPTRQFVAIRAKTLDLLQKIQFGVRNAILEPSSNLVLDQVAAVLLAHPEITRVRIEGNTDNAGPASVLQTLSERQAKAVKSYLVAHGVPAARLETVGYGGSRPIALNLTRMGREANQRIEMRIFRSAVAPPPSSALPAVEPSPIAPPTALPRVPAMAPASRLASPPPTALAPAGLPPLPAPVPRTASEQQKGSVESLGLPPLDLEQSGPAPAPVTKPTAPPASGGATQAAPAAAAKKPPAPKTTAAPSKKAKPPADLSLPSLDDLPPLNP